MLAAISRGPTHELSAYRTFETARLGTMRQDAVAVTKGKVNVTNHCYGFTPASFILCLIGLGQVNGIERLRSGMLRYNSQELRITR